MKEDSREGVSQEEDSKEGDSKEGVSQEEDFRTFQGLNLISPTFSMTTVSYFCASSEDVRPYTSESAYDYSIASTASHYHCQPHVQSISINVAFVYG